MKPLEKQLSALIAKVRKRKAMELQTAIDAFKSKIAEKNNERGE